jgi:multidrug resistance efflux pump
MVLVNNKNHHLRGEIIVRISQRNLMSRLNELEQKMNNLNNTVNAPEDELKDLQAIYRELKLTEFVDKFGKYIEEVEKVKEDMSCGMFDDIKSEQMKQLVESRVKNRTEGHRESKK